MTSRQPNPYASTSPSEIVTCRFDDGTELTVLCKYGASSSVGSCGHRGGAAYEAWVYEHILQPLAAGTPFFYGSYEERSQGRTWLVFEYLAGAARVGKTEQPNEAIARAARWIGSFHADADERFSTTQLYGLKEYDADYYAGWARRTSKFAGDLRERFPWLRGICEGFCELSHDLAERSTTVIHGEFYPQNVLIRGDRVAAVDWESAARGLGEIDLASLTERWPPDVSAACERHYGAARWKEGAPPDFDWAVDAGRLYLQLRWLGNNPESTMGESALWRIEQLNSVARRLGLL